MTEAGAQIGVGSGVQQDVAAGSRERHSVPDQEWVSRLSVPGPVRDQTIGHLHELMIRAAWHQVARMPESAALGAARRAEIVHSAADEATVSVLTRLSTFEGRSKFTTWAYKFGILHAGVELRRVAWRGREIDLGSIPEPSALGPTPESQAEGRDLARAVWRGLDEALTPHQRRITVALLVDDVPIDVLAERLGTTRSALYKTLHDARKRLRVFLADQGYLNLPSSKEATR
jgi:RNA polymerase sigma-70 factor, ECF subfamily